MVVKRDEIKWDEIKTIEDLKRKFGDSVLYDEEQEYGDNVYDFKLNPTLTAEEVEDALFWARLMRGIMLVTGSAGAGKGLFANMLAWKMGYYFGKKILLDYKPRRLFGVYHPFNEQVLVNQLSRMSNVAAVSVKKGIVESGGGRKSSELLENVAHEWIDSSNGQVFLKNSVLVLDEFKRYMYKRRPHNPMGITLGQIFDLWRHLDILIIGIAIDERELDRFSCIPKITTLVRCTWLNDYTIKKYNYAPYSARVDITPVRYVGVAGEGVLDMAGKTITRVVEGGKPRECLGGKRWVDIYNTKDPKDIFVPTSLKWAGKD